MKNRMFVLLALLFITACDDDDNSSNSKITEVKNTAIDGQWKVTYYFDTDTDETANFNGYVFDFGSNDVITATKGSTAHSGSWSVTDDVSGDDNSKGEFDDIDFNIAFSSPSDFEELSEDWEIISQTATKIELRHVSGGGGGTDLLTFGKL
jgi:hypothetical protein